MNADRRAHPIAIVSGDALLAALLGAAVELAGFRPSFPRVDESEVDALRRLKPRALLIDVRHPAASDHALLGRATMMGARIVLFGARAEIEAHTASATDHQLGALILPDDLDTLAEILSQAVVRGATRTQS
ncbi:MAG TPA: hypothetical protein VJ867_05820 [Gemmatimonadaceae bacterium]|nr:hypothetical protein [Gemmatimonadaceae bacterium]